MNQLSAYIRAVTTTAILLAASSWANGAEAEKEIRATGLKCEYLENPLCVESPTPRLSWKMEASPTAKRNQRQTWYRILAASSIELLDNDQADLWDSGTVEQGEEMQIQYGGKEVPEGKRCYWKVMVGNNHGETSDWSEPAYWGSGVRTWQADWIGDRPDTALAEYLNYVRTNNNRVDFDTERWSNPPTLASPMLRRSFKLDEKPREAVIYASALGYYELWINGHRVGDARQTPGWTDYNDYVQYQAYDVTPYLTEGENVIAATLADGWALGRLAGVKWMRSFPHRGFYAPDRRLIARLDVTTESGTEVSIATDDKWRINRNGYVKEADNFGGETIDAGSEPPGWKMTGFDDSNWDRATVDESTVRRLAAEPNEPIKTHKILTPKRIWKRGDAYMVDFGQNIAGHCTLNIRGERGDTVTLRHGEWLNDDGSLYTQSLGYAKATDRFVLSGGNDRFDPTFTYHGFQYVEVSGVRGELTEDMIAAKAVSSATRQTGWLECSNRDINQLFDNIMWTQRNNMFGVMTDNPSRDERTGAMGDIQIFAQSSMFNMDMGGFFTKFVRDAGEQAQNGQFMSMIPSLRNRGTWDGWIGAPGWCEAPLIVAWRMYENYGDRTAMASLYEKMKTHVDATLRENRDLIWRVRHNHNGDWLNANTISPTVDPTFDTTRGGTPDDVFATAFLGYATRLLSQMGEVLGKSEESRQYGATADEIKSRFVEEYVDADGRVAGESQGAYSIALFYDLVPESLRERCFEHLLKCIEEYDTRLSTGFITTPMMMQLLVEFGREDVAYELLTSHRFPSWLYIVDNGATTVWERWDAWIPGHGFQNPTMNSLDHVAFGAVAEWMYRHILGINPDIEHPGYEHFTLHPRPGGGLMYAKGAYDSPRGLIESEWTVDEDGSGTTYTFNVPPNSSATITLKADGPEDVEWLSIGVSESFQSSKTGEVSATVGSGTYRVRVKNWSCREY